MVMDTMNKIIYYMVMDTMSNINQGKGFKEDGWEGFSEEAHED